MKNLIFHEFKVQNKIHNITKYTLIFFIFCCLSITLINAYENIQTFGIIFAVISIPLAFISLSGNLIKPDIEDGSLEILITTSTPGKIILAKYIALCTCCSLSFFLTMPIIYLIYNIELTIFVAMVLSALILLFLSASLITLISAIQGYFRSNTNFLSILIMPLLIPNIILSGLFLQNHADLHLLFIMLGINLVIIPPALYLSSYLIENIYNI
jgi:heme exporter protein B